MGRFDLVLSLFSITKCQNYVARGSINKHLKNLFLALPDLEQEVFSLLISHIIYPDKK